MHFLPEGPQQSPDDAPLLLNGAAFAYMTD